MSRDLLKEGTRIMEILVAEEKVTVVPERHRALVLAANTILRYAPLDDYYPVSLRDLIWIVSGVFLNLGQTAEVLLYYTDIDTKEI